MLVLWDTRDQAFLLTYLLRMTHRQTPVQWPLFRKTSVTGTRKVQPIWILMKQEMMGLQWHQLDHMQIICTPLQTDNHAITPSSLNFSHGRCPSWRPTNSVKYSKKVTTPLLMCWYLRVNFLVCQLFNKPSHPENIYSISCSSKSRMVYLSCAGLPRWSWKKAVKWM